MSLWSSGISEWLFSGTVQQRSKYDLAVSAVKWLWGSPYYVYLEKTFFSLFLLFWAKICFAAFCAVIFMLEEGMCEERGLFPSASEESMAVPSSWLHRRLLTWLLLWTSWFWSASGLICRNPKVTPDCQPPSATSAWHELLRESKQVSPGASFSWERSKSLGNPEGLMLQAFIPSIWPAGCTYTTSKCGLLSVGCYIPFVLCRNWHNLPPNPLFSFSWYCWCCRIVHGRAIPGTALIPKTNRSGRSPF